MLISAKTPDQRIDRYLGTFKWDPRLRRCASRRPSMTGRDTARRWAQGRGGEGRAQVAGAVRKWTRPDPLQRVELPLT